MYFELRVRLYIHFDVEHVPSELVPLYNVSDFNHMHDFIHTNLRLKRKGGDYPKSSLERHDFPYFPF